MEFPPTKKRVRGDIGEQSDTTYIDNAFSHDGRRAKRARPISSAAEPQATKRHIVIHRVKCTRVGSDHDRHEPQADYFDVPRLRAGANRSSPLQGDQRIDDLESYLEDHDSISFAVYITYSCTQYHDDVKDIFHRLPISAMDPTVPPQAESDVHILQKDCWPAIAGSEALILSDAVGKALNTLSSSQPGFLKDWDAPRNLCYPYLYLYHHKDLLTGPAVEILESACQMHLRALAGYLDTHIGTEFMGAKELFEQGLVSREHWDKLFRPDEVIVISKHGHTVAYMAASCPILNGNNLMLRCWSWDFDGKFFRKDVELKMRWPFKSGIVAITDLNVYPLKYAKGGLETTLRERGVKFWDCRRRRYISYDVPFQDMEIQIANLRYMIDLKMYKVLHGDKETELERVELNEEAMNAECLPASPFALLLPAVVRGYGFQDKKWRLLDIQHIRDIEWNKDIFDRRLVLRAAKKDLIRALVTVHKDKIGAVKTDFMERKGEGLIILLHGAPGTGKTLTAESIAEHTKRPLYRVTCGDIGTNPEDVERYLESAFFIGSTWGCVVLLDEADVFLEARTKADLKRNALVSVFLRVLEYYNGILILTTNRVGTFDEAFKSRVHLALHYPRLDEESRRAVWCMLIQSLPERGERIDLDGIEKNLDVLARHSLNGRQIRNTINTARQLARYKEEMLQYVHIDEAASVVTEFEQYTNALHADEEYTRERMGL